MSDVKKNAVNEALQLPLGAELETRLADLLKSGEKVTLVMIDMDTFMKVNNTHGHEAGDKVLIDTGRYLQNALPEGAALFRFGGDFCFAELDAHVIMAAVNKPMTIQSNNAIKFCF